VAPNKLQLKDTGNNIFTASLLLNLSNQILQTIFSRPNPDWLSSTDQPGPGDKGTLTSALSFSHSTVSNQLNSFSITDTGASTTLPEIFG
jgi:hypothetical protein